jgi:hypothetical protein
MDGQASLQSQFSLEIRCVLITVMRHQKEQL